MDALAQFDSVPVNRELGFRVVHCAADSCRVAMAARAQHAQGEGLIQGGVITALADTAAVYLLLAQLGPLRTCTSIEFKLNFLNPARPDAGELLATATAKKRGRSVAVCAVDVEQAGKLVATGLFTYLTFDRAPR
jgi:uncharacterized protein (TIGR00369 family)